MSRFGDLRDRPVRFQRQIPPAEPLEQPAGGLSGKESATVGEPGDTVKSAVSKLMPSDEVSGRGVADIESSFTIGDGEPAVIGTESKLDDAPADRIGGG